jgi:hypothetical protein
MPTTATPSSDPVTASTLPPGDEHAVRVAHMAARARGNVGGVAVGLVQRGGYVYRREDAVEASELLAADGPERVTYRDTTYSVAVTDEQFHEPVYRATADRVATSPERMEAALRGKFVDARVSREGLSREARDAIGEARGEGYAESHPYSSAYEELLEALHARAYVDGNSRKDAGGRVRGERMRLYDGEYYDYRLRFRASDG